MPSRKEMMRQAFVDYLRLVYGGKGQVSNSKLLSFPENPIFPTYKDSGFNRELASLVSNMLANGGMQPQLPAGPPVPPSAGGMQPFSQQPGPDLGSEAPVNPFMV